MKRKNHLFLPQCARKMRFVRNQVLFLFLVIPGVVSRVQAATFTATKIADTNDGFCDEDCSLREALAATNLVNTVDNGIIFADSVFANSQTITLVLGELIVNNNGNSTLLIKGTGADFLSVSGNNQS